MKNPYFKPPRPVTLDPSYGKLIPNLTETCLPPRISVSKSEILDWISKTQSLGQSLIINNESTIAFTNWVHSSQQKVAPGFDVAVGVMKPAKRTLDSAKIIENHTQDAVGDINHELNKINMNSD